MLNFDTLINELKEAITALDQKPLFNKDTDRKKALFNACSNVLKYSGYRLIPPYLNPEVFKNIKNNKDLLYLFDMYRKRYCGASPIQHGNSYIDGKLISDFVKSRRDLNGCSIEEARRECALIIKTIFENIDVLKLKSTPRPYILGQKKCAWITQRALEIIDQEYQEHLKTEFEKIEAKTKRYYSDQDLGLLGDY